MAHPSGVVCRLAEPARHPRALEGPCGAETAREVSCAGGIGQPTCHDGMGMRADAMRSVRPCCLYSCQLGWHRSVPSICGTAVLRHASICVGGDSRDDDPGQPARQVRAGVLWHSTPPVAVEVGSPFMASGVFRCVRRRLLAIRSLGRRSPRPREATRMLYFLCVCVVSRSCYAAMPRCRCCADLSSSPRLVSSWRVVSRVTQPTVTPLYVVARVVMS